jgi:hypothetical protein
VTSFASRVTQGTIALLAILVAALILSSLYGTWGRRHGPRTGRQGHVVRVQVLNGSGQGGVGSRTAAFLREGGFHVVEVQNADRFDYFATLVVARREDVSSARAVARYLGGVPVVRQAWDSDLAEVTVVLGKDRSHFRLD